MVPRHLRVRWLELPLLGMVAGALEAGQAAAIYLLIRLMGEPRAIFEYNKLAPLRWLFEGATDFGILLRYAVLLALFHVVKNLTIIGSHYRRQKTHSGTLVALSNALFRGYVLAPLSFHFRRHSAELVSNTPSMTDRYAYRAFGLATHTVGTSVTPALFVGQIGRAHV